MLPIPKLKDLYNSIIADLQAEFGVVISTIRKNSLRAFSAVQSGKIYIYYTYIAKVQKNIFVDTADSELLGGTLERFGRVKLNRNPFPAQAGEYTVQVTGSVGAIIAAQTTFKSDDTSESPGFIFILDNAHTMASSTDTITLRSLTSGTVAKLAINDTLTATQPIALVSNTVTVTVETVQPKAAETLEEYRAKAINAYRLEPQGGAATDYRLWSYDVQGVQQAYPYAKSGEVSTVDVYIEATEEESTDSHGTPPQIMLDEVVEVIEFDPDDTRPTLERGRRPVTAIVNVRPVFPKPVDITITGYSGLTSDIENAIDAALKSEISKIRPFVAGCDVLADRNDIIDLNKIAYMIISAVNGSIFMSVSMTVDGSTVSSYQFSFGVIPYYNSVTFN